MKIAINSVTINHTMKSGLQVYTDNLIQNLADIDKENEYLLLYTSLRRKASEMPGPKRDKWRKGVIRIPDRSFPMRRVLLDNFFLPSILHKGGFNIFHAPAGYTLPKTTRIKKILTIHDLRSLRINDTTWPQDVKSYKASAHSADMCITVSETTKHDVVELFSVKPEKVFVTYLGVDDSFRSFDSGYTKKIIQRYGVKDKYFFSLGQVPRKNIERIIKAFGRFKYKDDFSLVIGGAGENEPWATQYRKTAKGCEVADRIKFIGYIPYSDLPAFYSSSFAFVFPSLYEGFGIPVLEAMRCETPVITSNVSALPEVSGGNAVLVDPYSEDTIEAGMNKIVEDAGLRKNLIEKGLQWSQTFSWRKTAEDTKRVYEMLG